MFSVVLDVLAVLDVVGGTRARSNSTDGVLDLPQRGLCDEIRVLELHRWNPTVSVVVDGQHLSAHCCRLSRPRGLVNLGNTCFLNATLQCLAYLPTFCQCVISLPNSSTSSSIQNQQGQKTVMTLGKKITMYMQLILGKMHGLPPDNTTSSIAPKALYSAIPLLSGSGRGYTFRPGRQEDAHEFLIHLLDTMQNGELQSAGKYIYLFIVMNKGWIIIHYHSCMSHLLNS
jgi:ubiquitin carboxyl-terminal hydrolase 36/42